MITDKQLAANRGNAQLSTGPATPQGKARAAQNSTTHGLASRNILLKGESLDEWLALREQLRQTYDVLGESPLLDDATHSTWKLMRIEQWQTLIIDSSLEHAEVPVALARLFGLVEQAERLHAHRRDAADRFGILVEGALGDRDCRRAEASDLRAPALDLGVELGRLDHRVDQPHLYSFTDIA